MEIETVVGLRHRGGSAFGGNGVAAHRINFRDQRNSQGGICFSGGNGSAESSSASADDDQIGSTGLHGVLPVKMSEEGKREGNPHFFQGEQYKTGHQR
jgi:hypothetical protein